METLSYLKMRSFNISNIVFLFCQNEIDVCGWVTIISPFHFQRVETTYDPLLHAIIAFLEMVCVTISKNAKRVKDKGEVLCQTTMGVKRRQKTIYDHTVHAE